MPVRDGYGNNDSRDGHGHHAQPVGQPEVGALAISIRLHVDSHLTEIHILEFTPILDYCCTVAYCSVGGTHSLFLDCQIEKGRNGFILLFLNA